MSKYTIPTDEQIALYLANICEANVEAQTELPVNCISCGREVPSDGYCNDIDCPNWKDGLIAEYLAKNGLT